MCIVPNPNPDPSPPEPDDEPKRRSVFLSFSPSFNDRFAAGNLMPGSAVYTLAAMSYHTPMIMQFYQKILTAESLTGLVLHPLYNYQTL